MTEFEQAIASLYSKGNGLMPFIGAAFTACSPTTFRGVVVGINSYLNDEDWKKPCEERRKWFRSWWQNAPHGAETHRFYRYAVQQAACLARFLQSEAPPWASLSLDMATDSKDSLYATNAIKVYTSEDLKKSSNIADDQYKEHLGIWNEELELMAQFDCLPHLIIFFGKKPWDLHFLSLTKDGGYTGQRFQVQSCEQIVDPSSSVRHHARLVTLDGGHKLFAVYLHHPNAWIRKADRQNAEWLVQVLRSSPQLTA